MNQSTLDHSLADRIEKFLSSAAFAVAGASTHREKYGNKVLRAYLQNHLTVYPVNPRAEEIEGIPCISSINKLPASVNSISIITPPKITEQLVNEIIAQGIQNVWMQPGAESEAALEKCEQNGINVIANGPCILVKLQYHE